MTATHDIATKGLNQGKKDMVPTENQKYILVCLLCFVSMEMRPQSSCRIWCAESSV